VHGVDDEVKIDSLEVNDESYCDSDGASYLKFLNFSAGGVVRLQLSNIEFVEVSYSVETSATGNDIDLLLFRLTAIA